MTTTPKSRRGPAYIGYLAADELCLQVALLLAFWLRHHAWAYGRPEYLAFGLLLLLADALVAILNHSFDDAGTRGFYKEAVRTLGHAALVLALSLVYMFAMQTGDVYSRITLFLMFGFHTLFGYAVRVVWKLYRQGHPAPAQSPRNLLVVTTPENAGELLERLKDVGKESPYRLAGLILTEASATYPVVSTLEAAADYICREWVDAVYIEAPLSDARISRLMEDCALMGIPTHYHMRELESIGTRHYSQQLGGTTVLTSAQNEMTPLQAAFKRLADILGGLLGSLATLLLILIVGPVIKLKSPGPVLYRQQRVGRNGKQFTLYKIRTMARDADERKASLEARNRNQDGLMFKLDDDPRVIPGIGHWLRRHSLDEFPQFFNVLAGQMSLVGTRPPTVDEYNKYRYHHRARLSMKPGLTGLWQVNGRSDITDFEEVVRLDMTYINNWDPGLDLRILARTVSVVISGKGAK